MKSITLLFFLIIAGCFYTQAQELVYRPVNSAFGGNPYNYQWLLSSAQSQNGFKDPNASGSEELTELEQFTKSLNSQLLGQVTRQLFTDQFGNSGLQPGSYTFGSLAVDIYPSDQGLVINILDTNTGEQTQIIIPN
ncbi:curli assembly protein CsgF [Gillisia sp. M10.2A]|uniref:Curli production assembly/transport component CsgF n=1 Tax=Gillisia lutea TaxID=2909668 RepID=A0ABS9EGN9_9FLAO|nr:curli production assembly/transport component CsgF [Gillisia lutea]MCF4102050.1 curli assembly protein CsgF [Gillisia lutea]